MRFFVLNWNGSPQILVELCVTSPYSSDKKEQKRCCTTLFHKQSKVCGAAGDGDTETILLKLCFMCVTTKDFHGLKIWALYFI